MDGFFFFFELKMQDKLKMIGVFKKRMFVQWKMKYFLLREDD